jgi:hypothetical protein
LPIAPSLPGFDLRNVRGRTNERTVAWSESQCLIHWRANQYAVFLSGKEIPNLTSECSTVVSFIQPTFAAVSR